MQLVDFLTVKRLAVPEGEPPSCDLLAHGEPVGRSVSGEKLEAAFAVGPFYLLMMSDAAEDAAGLTVHLLARENFEHIESVGMAWPFVAGRLEDLEVVGERALRFRFLGEEMILRVAERAGWRVPFMTEFAGVFRPFGFRRWMVLSRLRGV